MSYIDEALVQKIAELNSVDDIDDSLVTIADTMVEALVNYDMDSGSFTRNQYFDIENLNLYYVQYDGSREFVLDRMPVTSVESVIIDPISNPESLTEDTDYHVNYDTGIVTIEDDVAIEKGRKKLLISYNWGYSSVPNLVKTYASYLCAFLHENNIVAKNDNGVVLKEIEIGRYRELYDNSGSSIKAKYSVLKTLEEQVRAKYALSD